MDFYNYVALSPHVEEWPHELCAGGVDYRHKMGVRIPKQLYLDPFAAQLF